MKLILLIAILGVVRGQLRAMGGRIVGGEKSPVMYPYQVSLQVRRVGGSGGGGFLGFMKQDNFTHNCGGIIMKENVILTAAHCIKGYSRFLYVIPCYEVSERG